jgi:hypothetical protein
MRRGSNWVVLAVLASGSVACASEEADPVDLDGSGRPASSAPSPQTPTPQTPGAPGPLGTQSSADRNAESRQMARQYAEQQCLDDPDATEGIIRIVDPTTDQVVASVVVDCDEVRGASRSGADR